MQPAKPCDPFFNYELQRTLSDPPVLRKKRTLRKKQGQKIEVIDYVNNLFETVFAKAYMPINYSEMMSYLKTPGKWTAPIIIRPLSETHFAPGTFAVARRIKENKDIYVEETYFTAKKCDLTLSPSGYYFTASVGANKDTVTLYSPESIIKYSLINAVTCSGEPYHSSVKKRDV